MRILFLLLFNINKIITDRENKIAIPNLLSGVLMAEKKDILFTRNQKISPNGWEPPLPKNIPTRNIDKKGADMYNNFLCLNKEKKNTMYKEKREIMYGNLK